MPMLCSSLYAGMLAGSILLIVPALALRAVKKIAAAKVVMRMVASGFRSEGQQDAHPPGRPR
jgi:hypothetical protein